MNATVNFTAVDLTQLPGFSAWYTNGSFLGALLLNIRNTLPGTTFTQSELAVPFSTAQYQGGNQGWMGPYVPLVSYTLLSTLSATTFPPSLPSGGQPTSSPSNNEGNINLITNPQKLQTYPEQYWPASPL